MSSFEEMIEDIKRAIEAKERAAAPAPKPASGALNEAIETQVFEIDQDKLEAKKYFKLPGMKFAVIEGQTGWILLNNEAVHWTAGLNEPIKIHVYAPDREVDPTEEEKKQGTLRKHMVSIMPEPGDVELYLTELEEFAVPQTDISSPSAIDWTEWIHYFGVKDRIYHNYRLLEGTIKKIGANVNMPEWDWKR